MMAGAAADVVFLNGQWMPRDRARVPVEDRGFMFADGVYEVVQYYNRRPVAMPRHIDRLRNSLRELRIEMPDGGYDFAVLSDEIMRRNDLADAGVYWQVTRGVASRDHAFPDPPVQPTVLVMAYPIPPFEPELAEPVTLSAITRPDQRWLRCSIKSIALLPNVLARQEATDAGCREAILVRNGVVTEGTSRSILIVAGGELLTHPLDDTILGSITRQIVLDLAADAGMSCQEMRFSVEQLLEADEVIAVGTTTEVAAVTRVDDRTIGSGVVGPVTQQLHRAYREFITSECRIR